MILSTELIFNIVMADNSSKFPVFKKNLLILKHLTVYVCYYVIITVNIES
jgi:hypothetical protein